MMCLELETEVYPEVEIKPEWYDWDINRLYDNKQDKTE